MRYAVVINLDYSTHPYKVLRRAWAGIRHAMQQAGFRCEGRLFTVDLPADRAADLAYRVIDELESRLEAQGRHVYRYLQEFYGYPVGCATNLMVPPLDRLKVRARAS